MKDKIWREEKTFQPAAVGDTETKAIFNVAAGVAVIGAYYQVMTASAASSAVTMTLGDGDDVDGYIAAIDPETATLGAGAGAYLAADGGKLYAADDTVDVVYTVTTAGATNPKVKFTIIKRQVYP